MKTDESTFYEARVKERQDPDYSDKLQKVIEIIFDSMQKQKQNEK